MLSRRDAVRALAIAGIIILAVIFIMFIIISNYCCVDYFGPSKVIIEKATLTKIGDNKYDLTISVREVGGASTIIQRVVLIGGGLDGEKQCYPKSGQDTTLHAAQSKLLIYQCSLSLNPGTTYYVRVYYQKDEGSEATDLYPVTVK